MRGLDAARTGVELPGVDVLQSPAAAIHKLTSWAEPTAEIGRPPALAARSIAYRDSVGGGNFLRCKNIAKGELG